MTRQQIMDTDFASSDSSLITDGVHPMPSSTTVKKTHDMDHQRLHPEPNDDIVTHQRLRPTKRDHWVGDRIPMNDLQSASATPRRKECRVSPEDENNPCGPGEYCRPEDGGPLSKLGGFCVPLKLTDATTSTATDRVLLEERPYPVKDRQVSREELVKEILQLKEGEACDYTTQQGRDLCTPGCYCKKGDSRSSTLGGICTQTSMTELNLQFHGDEPYEKKERPPQERKPAHALVKTTIVDDVVTSGRRRVLHSSSPLTAHRSALVGAILMTVTWWLF
jgi:hypothetical protein